MGGFYMKKKNLVMLLGMVTVLGLAAGCSSQTQESTEDEQTVGETEENQEQESTAEETENVSTLAKGIVCWGDDLRNGEASAGAL